MKSTGFADPVLYFSPATLLTAHKQVEREIFCRRGRCRFGRKWNAPSTSRLWPVGPVTCGCNQISIRMLPFQCSRPFHSIRVLGMLIDSNKNGACHGESDRDTKEDFGENQ